MVQLVAILVGAGNFFNVTEKKASEKSDII